MPHRIQLMTNISEAIQAAILGAIAGWQSLDLASIITDEDWSKITGNQGALFLAVIASIVLWIRTVSKDKKDDLRHAEMISMQKENAQKLMDLTVECIKSNGKSTQAIERMDSTIQRLTIQMTDRPKQLNPMP